MGGATRSGVVLTAAGVLAAIAGTVGYAQNGPAQGPAAQAGGPIGNNGQVGGLPVAQDDAQTAQPSLEALREMFSGRGMGKGEDKDLKPFADVSKDYEKVVSTADGQASFYTVWTRQKDQGMLAELPRGYENQKHFIALTVASGYEYAGLQSGDMYVYWKRIGNRLVLMEPNIETRSTGDNESKSSVKRIFTDRVILDVPIAAIGPNGQPVIDMKDLLVDKAGTFFGGQARGANHALATIKTAKAFPENIEIAYEMPMSRGVIQNLHYSISLIKGTPSYQPRVADERVGYFTTTYRDLGKFKENEKWVRYVNRWNLEKKDPKLKVSPPKEPIVFYVEHTTPVRYRPFVKDGLLMWNKAFEKCGIRDAVEVYYQDQETGAHMEKDPEDVRYNFIRWLSNDMGTAIGPSRVNPMTGEILDADIILTDGWIRHFWGQYNEQLPEMAMEGFSPETLAWLESRPNWDPRVRMAPPEQRNELIAERLQRGVLKYGGHPIGQALEKDSHLYGTQEYDGLLNRTSQLNGLCLAAKGKAFDMAVGMMNLQLSGLLDDPEAAARAVGQETAEPDDKKDDKKDEDKEKKDKKPEPKYDTLDGIPDWFVGPMLTDLVAHEVGHTLGLRHNFKASSIYTLAEINSPDIKGKKPQTSSVMDYNPVNINMQDGVLQGDFCMIDIGPYDFWAIEYGYTLDDPKKVLQRVAEKEIPYGTDEDTIGPDPLIRRYDFAADPIAYAKSNMKLAKYHRDRLLDKFVKDGDSWAKARRGYGITLGMQTRSINMMSAWVGGAHVNRDRKGDPNGRAPLQVVPAADQREALKFVIENAFRDEAFGLTPQLLERMTVDKWMDAGGGGDAFGESTYPIHDRIMGVQAAALTMLMNPTTLRRVFDNEYRVPADQDAVTLPEVMDAIALAIWTELDSTPGQKFTARQPMISSLRRNLQREYVERLIDLTLPGGASGGAGKAVATLSVAKLRQLKEKLGKFVDDKNGTSANLDPYTAAHLAEAKIRIDKALDAQYVYNANSFGGGGFPYFLFGRPAGGDGAGQPK